MSEKGSPATRPGRRGPGQDAAQSSSVLSTYPLPSGEFPLATHFDVLRRFMTVSHNGTQTIEPTSTEGQGLPAGAAQTNAPFLCSIGLIVEEKPGFYKPSPVAMQFINTQIADEGRGRRLLQSILDKTWFGAAARSFLRSERAASYRESDLIAALAAATHTTASRSSGALHVLLEYLSYSGIVADQGPSVVPAKSPGAGSTPSLPSRGDASEKGPDWEVIQTSEFHLEIQPSLPAVRRLRQQLDLLDQKLRQESVHA